jgi:mono/diheme cytochrome c family protein
MVSAVLLAALALPQPPVPPPSSDEPGDLPRSSLTGEEFYKVECAVCHGQKGEGTARGTPLFGTQRIYGSQVVRKGRQGSKAFAIPMPAYSNADLTPTQLSEIWEFISQSPKAVTGEELYRSYCGHCHGANGDGGEVEVPIRRALSSLSVWVRYGGTSGDEDFLDRQQYMPSFNQKQLTDGELGLISEHLKSLP